MSNRVGYVWKLKGEEFYIMTNSPSESGTVIVTNVYKSGDGFYSNGETFRAEAEVTTERCVAYSKSGGYEKGNYVKFTLVATGSEYQQGSSYFQPCKLSIEYGPKFNDSEKSELVLEGGLICLNNDSKRYKFQRGGQLFSDTLNIDLSGLNDGGEMDLTLQDSYSGFFNEDKYGIELGSNTMYYPYAFEKVDGRWQIVFVGNPM